MELWSRVMPLLIIGVFAAGIWWWNRKNTSQSLGVLNVVRRAALLRNATLAVVEVGGRHFLVGATEHRVELLTELEDDLFAGMDAGVPTSEPWTDLFARTAEKAKSATLINFLVNRFALFQKSICLLI